MLTQMHGDVRNIGFQRWQLSKPNFSSADGLGFNTNSRIIKELRAMQKQQLLHRAEARHVFVSETDKTPAKEFDIFMHATLFQFSVLKYVDTMSQ